MLKRAPSEGFVSVSPAAWTCCPAAARSVATVHVLHVIAVSTITVILKSWRLVRLLKQSSNSTPPRATWGAHATHIHLQLQLSRLVSLTCQQTRAQ